MIEYGIWQIKKRKALVGSILNTKFYLNQWRMKSIKSIFLPQMPQYGIGFLSNQSGSKRTFLTKKNLQNFLR